MLKFSVSCLDNSVYLDCLGRGASLGVLRLAAMPNEALCGAVVPAPHSAMLILSVSFLDNSVCVMLILSHKHKQGL